MDRLSPSSSSRCLSPSRGTLNECLTSITPHLMRRSHRTSDRKCRPSSRHAPASHDINFQSCGPDFDGEITFAARETYTMIYKYRGLTLQRDRMYRNDQENRAEETQRSYETDSLHSKSYVCFTVRRLADWNYSRTGPKRPNEAMKLTLSTQNRTFASPAYAVWQTGIIQDLRIFNPVSVLSSSSGWYVNLDA